MDLFFEERFDRSRAWLTARAAITTPTTATYIERNTASKHKRIEEKSDSHSPTEELEDLDPDFVTDLTKSNEGWESFEAICMMLMIFK
jgi:hypothetical protein